MGAVTVPAVRKHLLVHAISRMLLLLLLSSATLHAQHQYVLGTSVNVVGGGDNDAQGSTILPGQSPRMEPFYGFYPSLELAVTGARSTMNLKYGYGWQRTESTRKLESETHTAGFQFENQFSPRWRTSIKESFSITDDAQTYYALAGVLPTPEGLAFYFYPVAADQKSKSNHTDVSFDHSFDARSSLSFGGSYSLRNYGSLAVRGLANQQDGGANVSYTRRTSERTSWNLGYSASYYQFSEFNDAMSHAARFGMSTEFLKDTAFTWSAGASQVRDRNGSSSFTSYEASAGVNQKIKDNLLQFNISQDNTSPSGLGSVSKSRRAGLGISRTFGRHVSFFANASVFDSKAILDNPYDARGGSATANVGFLLSRSVSLQVGGQYQRYTKPVIYAFTQKRVFISLRYTQPNLWRSR